MKVLSLFDGMSCGQIALSKLGVKVDKYYASEIDKYAIEITQKNFPDTIQLGDVCNLDPKDFMDVDLLLAGSPCQGFSFAGKQLAFDDPRSALFFEFVRLLKAIKPKYFLLENVRMKKEFLEVITEQVSACYTADDVASEYKDIFGSVKIEPHFINSSLLSAQSRQRYYWTNIPNIKQPEDKGIVLRDILETDPESITKMSDKFVERNGDKNCMIDQDKEKAHNLSAEEYVKNGRQGNYLACDEEGKPAYKPVKKTERNKRHLRQLDEKSLCMTATMYKGAGNNGMTLVPHKPNQVGKIKDGGQGNRIYSQDGKSSALSAQSGGTAGNGNTLIETKPKKVVLDVRSMTEVRTDEANRIRSEHKKKTGKDWSPRSMRHLVEREDEKSNTLTAALTKQHILQITENTNVQSYREVRTDEAKKARKEAKQKTGKDYTPFRAKKLEPRNDGKVGTVTPSLNKDHEISIEQEEIYWRKLTPRECERLQTVPDGYTEGVSNTQRYRMLGNGWTVDVIAHILTNMEK